MYGRAGRFQLFFMNQKVALLGIPFDLKSSFLPGAALAPARIRETLHNGAVNYWTEHTSNPIEDERFKDLGDLVPDNYLGIENLIASVLEAGNRTLTLGGDHSITYPIVKAYHRFYKDFEILQIDAHGDLYDEFEGDRYSHACPFARIMEEGLADRLIQVGVRTFNPHQREQAVRFGVETIEMKDFDRKMRSLVFQKPLYLSLDLDGLDPAYAPGVSHPEPGGLTTREVLRLIQNIGVPLIGADMVEFNPARDTSGITAALAAKLVKEISEKLLSSIEQADIVSHKRA
jgi:agmatinase